MVYGEQGKLVFFVGMLLWFNFSYSGDIIVLLFSDEGEVGCDIEVICLCDNWCLLVNVVFSFGEYVEMEVECLE